MIKVMDKVVLAVFLLFFSVSLLGASPLRSFDNLFPDLAENHRARVFHQAGLRNTFLSHETPRFSPCPNSRIELLDTIMEKNPTQLIQVLIVVPHTDRTFNKLDAYNAIGKIRNIRNQQVYSAARDRYITVFEESTRLQNGRRNSPIPDPPPANTLPASESIFFCLRDAFFGNIFFRGDFSDERYGINFNITNNQAIWYLIFPVMRSEKFAMVLYVEPLVEGMLIYGVAGIDIPEFFVVRTNLAFNIDRRTTIFINWLSDGLKSMN
jgi:hypothetical protein